MWGVLNPLIIIHQYPAHSRANSGVGAILACYILTMMPRLG